MSDVQHMRESIAERLHDRCDDGSSFGQTTDYHKAAHRREADAIMLIFVAAQERERYALRALLTAASNDRVLKAVSTWADAYPHEVRESVVTALRNAILQADAVLRAPASAERSGAAPADAATAEHSGETTDTREERMP